jgi:hypothetical protein
METAMWADSVIKQHILPEPRKAPPVSVHEASPTTDATSAAAIASVHLILRGTALIGWVARRCAVAWSRGGTKRTSAGGVARIMSASSRDRTERRTSRLHSRALHDLTGFGGLREPLAPLRCAIPGWVDVAHVGSGRLRWAGVRAEVCWRARAKCPVSPGLGKRDSLREGFCPYHLLSD